MKNEEYYNDKFHMLDLDELKNKYNLLGIKLIGDKLFITSKIDEWYIEFNDYHNSITLFHKNKCHITKRYHKEKKRFKNVFHVLGYIRKHDEKVYYANSKMLRLDKIYKQLALN